ncbi:YmfQ family protein [Blautia faecis]|uniref:putative phage tail protein n=1 Tax=Blautia faecis TaxID=871665 RepID=UPI001D0300F4|nr:putative phage tail protein [Blautia faecis]MCB5480604.1 YmfQ family protein [Blautia faecis]
MSIDLERFPWSDSANRMLTYVTKGWYDKSYVGKWIYEVMGRELDLATVHIEELPYQMFIDTATWGLKYHEIKYGLPVREDLSYEERRRLLREKKNTKAPMTPWRMEQILKGVTDYDVQVHDCNEPGYYFSHPNIFSVQLEGETEVELGEVKSKVDKLKQSHTVYLLSVILMLIECTESFEQRVTYHSDFSWWKYSLDGSFALDGSINLNHWYPTEFRPVYPFDTVLTENFIADRIFYRIPDVYHENIFKPSFFVRSDFVWWEGFLDGNFSLDGTRKLNSWYPMETFIGHRLFIGNQEAFETKQCISLPDMINAEKADFRGTQRVIMGWRDGNKILDGNCLLDGTLLLDAGEPPYLQTVRIRAPVKHEEEVEVTMVIPSRAARLDGTCRLDGSVKLNSGREVL